MIQISLTTALAVYSAILGVAAVAIWLFTELREQHVYRTLEKQHLWRCIFCSYVYLDEAAVTVSECPRCGSYNAIDDRHARYIKAPKALRKQRGEREEAQDQRRNPSRGKRPGARRRGPRRRGR